MEEHRGFFNDVARKYQGQFQGGFSSSQMLKYQENKGVACFVAHINRHTDSS
jgi:hypothetical protein